MFKNKHALACLSFLAVSAAVVACGSNADSSSDSSEADITSGTVRLDLVGTFEDKTQRTQDFGSLALGGDGTYSAKVLNTVAGSTVLCNHAPCNVPETGKWTATARRLRLVPDGQPVRIYVFGAGLTGDDLHLERGDSVQDLHVVPSG